MTIWSSGLALTAGLLLAMSTLLVGRWRSWNPGSADEAYVWYGTLRLLEGKVPVRDFRSYEPGRYLWNAPFMLAFGKGVQSIRLASLTFYTLCLFLAGHIFLSLGVSVLAVANLAITAIGTVREIYKLYEPGIAWLWITSATLSLASPTSSNGVLLGGIVGLAAVFGLNLALYTSGASVALMIWLLVQKQLTLPFLLAAAIGLAIGLAPLILYWMMAPGFGSAVIERRVSTILSRGTTNLPLPIPFPWARDTWAGARSQRLRRLLISISFLVLPALPAMTLALQMAIPTFLAPTNQLVLLPAACLGLFTWHHAFSRADEWHLCQSHVPALILAILVLNETQQGSTLLFFWLLVTSLLYLRDIKLRAQSHLPAQWVKSGSLHEMTENSRQIIKFIDNELMRSSDNAQDLILAVPTTLWLLPILCCRSPVYDMYCVYPASKNAQRRMINEIKSSPVELAIIDDSPLDGRQDLRFSQTHPRVLAWLKRHFKVVECALPSNLEMFRRYR